ncbi:MULTISPECIES: OmpA family protein [Streptosporangium]|uniref:OmpA-like domain-containing protein n=1 Tax=Streptosporangium brasiliense TaxID=47480 RepID=A0ABT9RKX2_9ACTN|nr:OmpA family protein [Streptosporangium brasiliense]MDP9869939.1 hypothetical protein [Streptosporangium brasiliense]
MPDRILRASGTDAVNDPLSQRRAQAVQSALAALLTRGGVRFQARGYGSRRPLYGNDTDEGKRRNRPVNVTFTKPRPKSEQADPAEDLARTLAPEAGELEVPVR